MFRQKNYPQQLGFCSGITIASHGCLLCCFASLAVKCGKNVDPLSLNQIFKDRKIYVDGCELTDWAITQVFPDIKHEETKFYVSLPADLNYIRQKLAEGKFIICGIDFYPATNAPDYHFVEVVRARNGDFEIEDSWYAENGQLMSKYYGTPARAILKVIVYSGQRVEENAVIPKQKLNELLEIEKKYQIFVNNGIITIDDVNKLKQEIRDRDDFIQGQKSQILVLENSLAEIAKKLGIANNYALIIGEITKLIENENTCQELNRKIKELENRVAQAELDNQKLKEDISLVNSEKQRLLGALHEANEAKKSLEKDIERLKESNQYFSNQLEKKEMEIKILKKERGAIKSFVIGNFIIKIFLKNKK